MPPERTPMITKEVWKIHEHAIDDMYIDQGLSLRELASRMRYEHGFDASLSQYGLYLRKHNKAKNVKIEEWKATGAVLRRLDEENTKYRVKFLGQLLDPARIAKSRKRAQRTNSGATGFSSEDISFGSNRLTVEIWCDGKWKIYGRDSHDVDPRIPSPPSSYTNVDTEENIYKHPSDWSTNPVRHSSREPLPVETSSDLATSPSKGHPVPLDGQLPPTELPLVGNAGVLDDTAAPLFGDIDLAQPREDLNSVQALANTASNENLSHFQLSERDILNSLTRLADQQLSLNPAPGTWFVDSDDLRESLSSLLPDESTRTSAEILVGSNDESEASGSSLFDALLFSIVNSFAGLEGLPPGSLIRTLKSEPSIRERLFPYMNSQSSFARPLLDNLFRAAVEALDEEAVMSIFHLADNLPLALQYGIDQDSISCKAFDEDKMYTPIMLAAKFRHVGIVRALLERGASLKQPLRDLEDQGEECGVLDIALRKSENFEMLDTTLVRIIVENRAYVRSKHVLAAARWGEAELTTDLLSLSGLSEHHAFFGYEDGRLNDPPPSGAGIFYNVVKFPNDIALKIIVEIFRQCEASACQKCPKGAQSMLEDIIFHATVRGNHQLVHFLLHHVPEDFSALSAAVRNGDRSMIDLMLRRGSSMNEPVRQMNESLDRFWLDDDDVIPTTPLAEAIRSQDKLLVEELEILGALDSLKDHLHFVAATYAAAEAGDSPYLQSLLEGQPKKRGINLTSALVGAIKNDHTELAVILINAGSEVDPEADTNNPLLEALKRRNRVVINRILEVATPPFSFSSRDFILEAAVRWGDTSIIKDLVLMGCCVGGGPLALAVELGNMHLVQLLLEYGTPLGDMALFTACKKDDEPMIRLLLDHGASPGDGSALRWSKDNNSRAFDILLESFVKSYSRHDEYLGGIALISAIETDAHGLVDSVLRGNLEAAKTFTTHRGMDRTALGVAISHENSSNFYTVDQLLRRGIGVNSIVQRPSRHLDAEIIGTEICSYGLSHLANVHSGILPSLSTALLVAIGTKNEKMVDFLVEHGADINQPARRGVRYTPLQYACVVGRFRIIARLVEHGADIKAPPAENGGGTAFQFTAISGRVKVAQFLLARGADPNEPPAPMNGRTALEGAAEHGRLSMMEMIFKSTGWAFARESIMRAKLLAEGRGHAGCARYLALMSFRSEANTRCPVII